jgi:DNA polymerase-1
MEQVVKETKEHGYVTTHWGRRRPVPGIYETNHSLYQLARRIAINTKAQGTAAELMKIGMIKLSKALAQEIPDAKMVLQIHDELLVTVPKKHAPQACTLVQKILQNVVDWDVPLDVTIRSGENWHDVSK